MNELLNYLHYHGFDVSINYNHELDFFDVTARKENRLIQIVGTIVNDDEKWEITVTKNYFMVRGNNCPFNTWAMLLDDEV